MSVLDDPDTVVTSFGWYKKNKAYAVLTCVEKLRKCSRCDHFPCPCCENWCDTVSSWMLGNDRDDAPVRCACEEDMECVFSEEDQVMNHVICMWMRKEIQRLGAVSCTEDAEGRIVILIPVETL